MAKRTLTFDIETADAQTIKALRAIQKEMLATGGTATKATQKAKSVGADYKDFVKGLAVAAAGRFAIGEAEQAQQTEARTAAVIKSTGNAAEVSAAQQNELVQSRSKMAAVDDDVVASGANLLRTFSAIKGPEAFGGALTAALDLSAALGTDLQSATIQVGKALQDPVRGITALRRAGVSFTEQQREQIKAMVAAGDTAGAQKVILAELSKEFGGSAEAMATDSARAKVAIGEAGEAAGKVLAPGVKAAADALTGLAGVFGELPQPAQQAVLGLGALAVLGPKVGDGFRTLGGYASSAKGYLDKASAAAQGLRATSVATTVATEGLAAAELEQAGAAGTATGATEALTAAERAQAGAARQASTASIGVGGAAVAAVAGVAAFAGTTKLLNDNFAQSKISADALSTSIDNMAGGAPAATADINTLALSIGATSNDGLGRRVADLKDGIIGLGTLNFGKAIGAAADVANLRESSATLEAYNDQLLELVKAGKVDEADAAFGKIVTALQAQGVEMGSITDAFGPYIDASVAADQATARGEVVIEGKTRALTELERHYISTTNAQKAVTAADKAYANSTALDSAIESAASAQEDLTKAREAEAGNSDEYRAAVKQEQDDLKQLAEDQAAVTAAKADAIDAQHELTQARVEAAQKVDDLRNSVVKAATAERDSIGALHDAQREAAAIAAKGDAATPAEKEHAALALADAQDAVTQAHRDSLLAQRESSQASIETDSGVISAHKRVEDAAKAIGAAERKVADDRTAIAADGVAKAKILNDAAQTREAAERRVEAALVDEAAAFRQIETDSKGPIAGMEAYAAALGSIENASPEVRRLLAAVQRAIEEAKTSAGPPTHDPESHTGAPQGPPSPGSRKPGGGKSLPRNLSGGGGPTINVTVNAGPTPREHARASGAAVGGAIGKLVRAGR